VITSSSLFVLTVPLNTNQLTDFSNSELKALSIVNSELVVFACSHRVLHHLSWQKVLWHATLTASIQLLSDRCLR